MRENNLVISNYNAHLDTLIQESEAIYAEAKLNRKAFEQLLVANRDNTLSNPLLTMVYNHLNDGTEYDWNKLKATFAGGLQPTRIVKPYIKANTKDIVMSYYNSFRDYAMTEIKAYRDLQELLAIRLPKVTISKLLNEYFITIGKLLLSEPYFNYHINSRLRITIKGKSRRKKRYNYIPKQAPINWGESIKLLKEIASIENDELLEDFNKKLIDKRTFIEGMKPYTYNKNTNPDGKKWLVRCNDEFGYWVILRKSTHCSEKEMLYSITPNNNRHVGKPIDDYIFNDLQTVDRVIEDKVLGFADKVRALSKIDNEYCLNTFYNDLQTN